MAERGAYLTGTAFARPSIFEIAAHKSLGATLEPAAKKIITFLASVNPEKYAWVYQWSDEIYLLLISSLQNYYLKNYCASFSETFYGLKRVTFKDTIAQSTLDQKRKNLSLVILVIFPYLQRKIEKWENQNSDVTSIQENKLKHYVIKIYKIINVLKEIVSLHQYLMYLSNQSKYPTISLRLLSITLTYANNDGDISLVELLKKLKSGNFISSDGLEVFRLILMRSIEVGAFFLQFLQWWNQEHYYSINLNSLPIPPPPQIPEKATQYKGICPICHKPPWIHTVVSTSGFIYCYQCILSEIRKNKKCPVTGYPAKEDHLIRLYIE